MTMTLWFDNVHSLLFDIRYVFHQLDQRVVGWRKSSPKQRNHVKISRMKSQVNGQWSHKFENVCTNRKRFTTQLIIQTPLTFSSSSIITVLFNCKQSSFIPGAYFAPALGTAKSVFPRLATRDSYIVWWLCKVTEQSTIFCVSKGQNDVASQLPKNATNDWTKVLL